MNLSSCTQLTNAQQADGRGDRLKEWREGIVVDERTEKEYAETSEHGVKLRFTKTHVFRSTKKISCDS